MNWLKQNWSKVILVVVVALGGYFLLSKKLDTPKQEAANITPEVPATSLNNLSDEEIKTQLGDTLNVLQGLHYVSLVNRPLNNPDTFILDEIAEAMDDKNKLRGLSYKTETLSKSGNELISTIGKLLHISIFSLTTAYENWIQYLRAVDINTIDLAEFQYQLALFQSSTHDVYLTLVENAALLPMITVEFAKEEGGKNSIKEEIKTYFLTKIDELFEDILVDNEKFYAETKNRYAIAILIQGYKDFFN